MAKHPKYKLQKLLFKNIYSITKWRVPGKYVCNSVIFLLTTLQEHLNAEEKRLNIRCLQVVFSFWADR